MRYYQLILDDQIIGVASSDNFIKFSPVTESFLRSNEEEGEYINWHSNLYRATWMQPIQFQVEYTEVQAIEINVDQYNSYLHAFMVNDTIQYEREQEEEYQEEPFVDIINMNAMEFARESKLNEMSRACRATIENGFDLAIRGETCHFSLTTQDQLNLMSLSSMAQTQELIPYHADGEMCDFYTAAEINQIIAAATEFKNYQIAYHNALKAYINALSTTEEIGAVAYGMEIPDEYKSDVLKILE